MSIFRTFTGDSLANKVLTVNMKLIKGGPFHAFTVY